jgi:Holliday junction DNA helicase RuvA
MIASLRGRLAEKQPTRVIVDVGGVGYEVHVPLSTFYALGEVGTDVTLRVHTYVREDTIALFGFASGFELALFERLIAITGVGPRLALAVLSGIEPAELVRAVRRRDVARLTAIPGVGRKTAERIGLELQDRLPADLERELGGAPPAAGEALRGDLLSALVNLGYPRAAAERAIDQVLARRADASFDACLRDTLRVLTR